jgi:serine protease Do
MKQYTKKNSRRLRFAFLIGLLLVIGSTVGFSKISEKVNAKKHAPVNLSVDETPLERTGEFTTSFAPVIKEVAPSVVNVFTTIKAKEIRGRHPFPNSSDNFFRHFLEDFGFGPSDRTFRIPDKNGLGSGVIMTADGYIVTNNHVVDKADIIKVALTTNGKQYKAEVVGRDPKTDIAVLKIDAKNLPYATVTDSDNIEVGDLVLAIGNPFGVGQTVTMGMISGKGRSGQIGIDLDYKNFIQTDAAINPGNSGGPLVDAQGRLIGINTAIVSRSGGDNGINFAIPANMVRSVMNSLVNHGEVIRGYLGVIIQDITPGLARVFELPDSKGALVSEVAANSPAQEAGLLAEDVIIEFNGKDVRDMSHCRVLVAQTDPDTEVPVTVYRKGEKVSLTVILASRPSDDELDRPNSSQQKTEASDVLDGVVVDDIDGEVRQRFNIPRNIKGAIIVEVARDSASFKEGLRPGDVVQEINHTPVKDAEHAVKLSENVDGNRVLIKVWTQAQRVSRFMVIEEDSE